jgi:hypothetical protein
MGNESIESSKFWEKHLLSKEMTHKFISFLNTYSGSILTTVEFKNKILWNKYLLWMDRTYSYETLDELVEFLKNFNWWKDIQFIEATYSENNLVDLAFLFYNHDNELIFSCDSVLFTGTGAPDTESLSDAYWDITQDIKKEITPQKPKVFLPKSITTKFNDILDKILNRN